MRVAHNTRALRCDACADSRRLVLAELQRKTAWFSAVLVRGKLFFFTPVLDEAHEAVAVPRHVLSLVGASVRQTPGTFTFNVVTHGADTQFSAPTRDEARQWVDVLRAAAMTEAQYRRLVTPVTHAADAFTVEDAIPPRPSHQEAVFENEAEDLGRDAVTAQSSTLQRAPARVSSELEMTPRHSSLRIIEATSQADAAPQEDAESGRRRTMRAQRAEDARMSTVAESGQQQPDEDAETLQRELHVASSTAVAEDKTAAAARAQTEQRRAAARHAIEQQSAWMPRSTHAQVEKFLLRFPDVPRREAYALQREFDSFDEEKRGELDVYAAMRLLEARHETRTFMQLREMVEGAHVQSSLRHMSLLEWACAVFGKSWLDLCLEEASRGGDAQQEPGAEQEQEQRDALYQARRSADEEEERAEAQQRERDLARGREAIRQRGLLFEHAAQ